MAFSPRRANLEPAVEQVRCNGASALRKEYDTELCLARNRQAAPQAPPKRRSFKALDQLVDVSLPPCNGALSDAHRAWVDAKLDPLVQGRPADRHAAQDFVDAKQAIATLLGGALVTHMQSFQQRACSPIVDSLDTEEAAPITSLRFEGLSQSMHQYFWNSLSLGYLILASVSSARLLQRRLQPVPIVKLCSVRWAATVQTRLALSRIDRRVWFQGRLQ